MYAIHHAIVTPGRGGINVFLLNVKTSPRHIRVMTRNTRVITQNIRVITQNIRVITQNPRVISQKIRVITQNIRVITQNIRVITQNILGITQNIRVITQNSGWISFSGVCSEQHRRGGGSFSVEGVFGVLGRVDGGIPRPLLAPSFILQTGLILPRHF